MVFPGRPQFPLLFIWNGRYPFFFCSTFPSPRDGFFPFSVMENPVNGGGLRQWVESSPIAPDFPPGERIVYGKVFPYRRLSSSPRSAARPLRLTTPPKHLLHPECPVLPMSSTLTMLPGKILDMFTPSLLPPPSSSHTIFFVLKRTHPRLLRFQGLTIFSLFKLLPFRSLLHYGGPLSPTHP